MKEPMEGHEIELDLFSEIQSCEARCGHCIPTWICVGPTPEYVGLKLDQHLFSVHRMGSGT